MKGLQLRTTKRVLKSNEECRVSNHPLADDQDKERFIVRRRESLNYLSCDRDFSLTYHFFFRYTRTFWYLLGFLWFEGCWRYKDEIEAPAILSVKDCDGTSLSPNVARRTLGVRLAPDGNNEDEVKHLRGVAEKWKDHIRTGHLQQHEAWYALTATVMKTIEYPLLALTLTKEQCTHMPVLMSGLPACGKNDTFQETFCMRP